MKCPLMDVACPGKEQMNGYLPGLSRVNWIVWVPSFSSSFVPAMTSSLLGVQCRSLPFGPSWMAAIATVSAEPGLTTTRLCCMSSGLLKMSLILFPFLMLMSATSNLIPFLMQLTWTVVTLPLLLMIPFLSFFTAFLMIPLSLRFASAYFSASADHLLAG